MYQYLCVWSLSVSLSRVLDMARFWCTASFAIIVGSDDVSPPLPSCNGLSFTFEVILSDWVFKDLRALDVCLACAYLWWQWDITWYNWCMFWWSTCGFGDLVNLCIGVGTHFLLDSLVETLGHSLKFFVLVWIDESEIVWCISYNQTTDTWGFGWFVS